MWTLGLEARRRIGEGRLAVQREAVAIARTDVGDEPFEVPVAFRGEGGRRTSIDDHVDAVVNRRPDAEVRAQRLRLRANRPSPMNGDLAGRGRERARGGQRVCSTC